MAASTVSPADALLGLLQALTAASQRFLVWKNADRALGGHGDLDCVAPRRDWPQLQALLDRWALEQSAPPFVACTHLIDAVLNVTVLPGKSRLFEIDFCERQSFRGAALFTADDLEPLSVPDPRGFRRLRPGAEGLYKLLLKGTDFAGCPRSHEIEGIRALLQHDPEGAQLAAERLGRRRAPAQALISAVEAGQWNRPASLAVQAMSATAALASPLTLRTRARARRRLRNPCSVLSTVIENDRAVPGEPAAWLAGAAAEHHEAAP